MLYHVAFSADTLLKVVVSLMIVKGWFMVTFTDAYSQDRIESVRSRFLNKMVRCNLLGQALRAIVIAVSDDGRVEVRCSPLGFTSFSTFTNVDVAYTLFRLAEEDADMCMHHVERGSSGS